MLSILMLGVLSGIVSFLFINLIPFWVFIVMTILAILFLFPQVIKLRRGNSSIEIQNAFQKPLQQAAALALLVQFLVPWLDQLFHLGLF